MSVIRMFAAYVAALVATYVPASIFYTQQVIASHAAFGAGYTQAQQVETYLTNLWGLWPYGAMIAVALPVGFAVAALVKRVLRPLAPIAYPAAGAVAMYVLLIVAEAQLGGGAGIMGGALTPLGMALQSAAGAFGGLVFAITRPR